jgi:hypothetical protein
MQRRQGGLEDDDTADERKYITNQGYLQFTMGLWI